ncbi:MAG: hypothetical protein GC191_00975 [Azospirillum sp.]|nr:hypothetical protein [Azospirillum sp.]
MFYEFSSDTSGHEGYDDIQCIVISGRFTIGSRAREMEFQFTEYPAAKHAVTSNSGASINLSAIPAFFHNEDPPLQQYGLRIRFVDVALDTLNADASEFGAALTIGDTLSRWLPVVSADGRTRDLPPGSGRFEPREEGVFEAGDFIVAGDNLGPPEISSALGVEQLEQPPSVTARLRENPARFTALSAGDQRFAIQ